MANENENKLLERIKQVVVLSHVTVNRFSIKIGMNQPTISRILNGEQRMSLTLVLNILANCPEISAEWLMRGQGEPLVSENEKKTEERMTEKAIYYKDEYERMKEHLQAQMKLLVDMTTDLEQKRAQIEDLMQKTNS